MKSPIFDPTPELASDLEWMLQSRQATREMLLEALAQEYYTPLYHLALSILDDSQAAQWAVDDTLAQALLTSYRYRDQLGVRLWLYTIALEQFSKAQSRLERRRALKATLPGQKKAEDFGVSTPQNALDADLWLAVDALGDDARLVALLAYAHGWSASEITSTLQLKPEEAAARLGEARRQMLDLLRRQNEAPAHYPPVRSDNLDNLLKRSLGARWPPPELTQAALDQAMERILRKTRIGSLRRQSITHFKEIVFTIFAIVAVVGILWWTNLIWPEPQSGEATTIFVTKVVYQEITATPQVMATQDEANTDNATPRSDFNARFYLVRPGDTLISIARRFDVPLEELVELNRLADEETLTPGRRLLIPGTIPPNTVHKATAVPQNPELDPLKTPYSSNDILQRMRIGGALFDTVWIDTQLIDYGPLGYIGPVHATRAQAWVGTDQALVLAGPLQGDLEEVRLRLGDHMYLARPSESQPWFLEIEQWGLESDSQSEDLETLFKSIMDSRNLTPGYTFKGLRREKAANDRETLVVDQSDEAGNRVARLWLDDRTGLVLRKREYGGEDFETLLREVIVTEIAYDVDFPQELFTAELPWRGGFARSYDGKPADESLSPLPILTNREPLPKIPAPEGFDPSRSQLTIQYTDLIGDINALTMELFADQYYLGYALFGDPWTTICQRSPDGNTVAYVSQPSKEVSWASRLHWFSLTLSDNARSPNEQVAVTQFAFAPDSQGLAFFGFEEPFSLGSLYVTNLTDTRTETLLKLADAKSLVWSADGRFLAFIARYQQTSYNEYVVVIDVPRKSVTYNEPIDFQSGGFTDWPMAEWGVEFPVEMSQIEDCFTPPE